MKKLPVIIFVLFMAIFPAGNSLKAQDEIDSLKKQITIDSLRQAAHLLQDLYDRDKNKLIPDRVIEIGLPTALILIFFYVVLTIIRINANKALKIRMIEKGLPEETLKQLFTFSRTEPMFGALKWGLVLAGTGAGAVVAHFLPFGLMTFGIITLFAALGFYIYYLLLKNSPDYLTIINFYESHANHCNGNFMPVAEHHFVPGTARQQANHCQRTG
ncbi:DUF6249 domain-containing protein [Paraflavitalea speifideaquila]|uniref:DUF6249 domain-containing protein n=1 Tax=Paraflavitalea speifideaquila TaxID=3076558 RepID=UPI0028ECD4DC|nr:DUF6249 domain-containing protein [Paraflavitalea speifideiaquila]